MGITIGRLAPSPTGAQHVGNARTYLIAWLLCRRHRENRMLLRIEDLETPRVKLWAIDQIFKDLSWLGLNWDSNSVLEESARMEIHASPTAGTHPPLIIQSQRRERYQEIKQRLLEMEAIYPCTCSRSDIASASAPHEATLDGARYPGTCAHRSARDCEALAHQGVRFSLRFRTSDLPLTWIDRFVGSQTMNVQQQLGDFVVWRNDDQAAYQLAVVIDDHDSHVNQVVRGGDLIYSTFRQLQLSKALDWPCPEYTHLPLVVGIDGKRLAKRHGDTRLDWLRSAGVEAEQLIGFLAWKSGMLDAPRQTSAHDLLHIDPLRNLPSEPLEFHLERDLPVIKAIQ